MKQLKGIQKTNKAALVQIAAAHVQKVELRRLQLGKAEFHLPTGGAERQIGPFNFDIFCFLMFNFFRKEIL